VSDSSQPHPSLRATRAGALLTLTLCQPDRRNTQVPSLWTCLAEQAAGLDPDVRVVVVEAEGPSFSAGLDRAMFTTEGVPGEPSLVGLAASGTDAAESAIADFQRGFALWRASPAVVVAAVQGHAIGAGFQLALAADLRVVADDVQFAMRETSLGLVPDLAGTQPLVQLVGYSRALEICATGRFVGAPEAVAIGLASLAVAPDQLRAATADLVAAVLAAPDTALRELKPLLRAAAEGGPLEGQLELERAAQARLLAGMAARHTGLGS
jgi:enoyl-CoA hydratase/carnithine racemase